MSAQALLGKQLRRLGDSLLCRLQEAVQRPLCARSLFTFALCFILFAAPFYGIVKTSWQHTVMARISPRTMTVNVELPDLSEQLAVLTSRQHVESRRLRIGDDQTLLSLLAALGIKDSEAERFILSEQAAKPLLHPRSGQFVSAELFGDGTIRQLRIFLDQPLTERVDVLTLYRDGTRLICEQTPFEYDIRLEALGGVVTGPIDASLKKAGIPEKIIGQMHDAFDVDRDQLHQMRKGDAFRIVYESKFADGNFVRHGRLLAMQFEHQGKSTELFWFNNDDRGGNYYDAQGLISRRTFMRVPLDIQSVSSEFSPMRRHPVTGVLRPHNGTDFRAPWGATVRAAADGVVTFAGVGSGWGKFIRIKHGPDYVTLYAHLSRINKNIRSGTKVKRGEIIGRVGQTGLATGPHLHYELKIGDIQINPMTARLPDTDHLTPYQLARLTAQIKPLRERLESITISDIETQGTTP